MNWSLPDWEPPMFVKVPFIAFLVCAGAAAVIASFVLFFNIVASLFGEGAAIGAILSAAVFGLVCLFTWIFLEA